MESRLLLVCVEAYVCGVCIQMMSRYQWSTERHNGGNGGVRVQSACSRAMSGGPPFQDSHRLGGYPGRRHLYPEIRH